MKCLSVLPLSTAAGLVHDVCVIISQSVCTSAFAPLCMCLYTPALPLRVTNGLQLMHIPSSSVPMAVYVLTCCPSLYVYAGQMSSVTVGATVV